MQTVGAKKLNREFYLNDTLEVAKQLLGKTFVRVLNGVTLAGKITETEAYIGSVDESSHSFNGKTKRNEVMFGEGGHLYVYFTYGMYFCANVVTGKAGVGDAVLIRAMEPLNGLSMLAKNRFGKSVITEREKINLLTGPAKICMAFDITKEENGADLLGEEFFILDSESIPEQAIITTERVGISKSKDLPWRFYINNSKFISRK
jgi:DNA-3-methyladenine glycosylase